MSDAAVCVLVDAVGRVLAVSRDGDPHDMALPGGHVEPGETPERAAIREVLEETGLSVSSLEKVLEHREPGEDGKLVHVYVARSSDAHAREIVPEPGEFARFVPVSELTGARSFGAFARRYADRLFPSSSSAIRSPTRLPERVSADLGPSGVHVDALGGGYRLETERERNPKVPDLSGLASPGFVQPTPPRREDVLPHPRWPLSDQVNMISAAKRRSLPADKFALPEKSAYPIDTAARVRNAAARLEQNKGRLSAGEYSSAKARIARAAKKFGIHSEYNAPETKAVDREPATSKIVPHMSVSAVIPHGGHLHVRHLSEDRSQVLALDDEGGEYYSITTLLDDVGASDGPVWNQVACNGAFRGHPAGPFELNEAVFREIIQNWERGGRKPIPVDFEHASEAEATAGSIPQKGAPAQAWIVDLRLSADGSGLDGLFDDWDPTARSYVKTKKYRFFSPAIRFGSKDKVSGRPIGARLTSGALTNQPFLDNLPALKARTPTGDLIAAKDSGATSYEVRPGTFDEPRTFALSYVTPSSEYMPKLKACLGMHPLSTPDEMKDHLDRLRDHLAKAGGNVNANVNGVSLAAYVHPLRSLTYGDSAHAITAEQILDAVEHMIDAAIAEHVAEEHGGASMAAYGDDDAADVSMATAVESDKVPMATAVESDKVPMATAVESDKQPAAMAALTDTKPGEETMPTPTMAELQADNAAKDAEIKTLSDKIADLQKWKSEREEADLAADVEFALSAHADKVATLGANDDERRTHLMSLRKESPSSFSRLYPTDVDPMKAILLRTVTPPAPKDDPRTAASPTGYPEIDVILANEENVDDTAERLCSEKKISFLEASEQAIRLHNLLPAFTA